MNRAELTIEVAKKAGITKKAAAGAVNAVFDSITGALARLEKVQLVGFGTFSVVPKASRKGRNPQTGAEVIIPAHNAPVFKAGAPLKDLVN